MTTFLVTCIVLRSRVAAAPSVMALAMFVPADAGAQGPTDPLQPIDDSIDYSDYPRLPSDFDVPVRLPEPESLVELFVEGDTGLLYDSNIFRTDTDDEWDVASISRARVSLLFDRPTVEAELALDTVIGRYRNFSRNNYEDFGSTLRAMWGDKDASYAELNGAFGRSHTSIGADLDEPETNAAEVTEFYTAKVAIDGAIDLDAYRIEPMAAVRVLDYQDSERLNGETIDNDGKDRIEFGGAVRLVAQVDMDWLTSTSFLVDGGGAVRLFHNAEADAVNRDSFDGFGRIGIGFEQNDLALSGEIGAGPAVFVPNDSNLDTVVDAALYGTLQWSPDPANRIELTVERRLRDTLFATASAIVATAYEAEYSNQVTEDLRLGLGGGIEHLEYQINSDLPEMQRDDLIYRVEASANYGITDELYASLSLSYVGNDSTEPSAEYASTRVYLNVGIDF